MALEESAVELLDTSRLCRRANHEGGVVARPDPTMTMNVRARLKLEHGERIHDAEERGEGIVDPMPTPSTPTTLSRRVDDHD